VVAALLQPDTVLCVHLRNHYALLFGARQLAADGARELLTARRGQKPAHWVPWDELRAALLRAPGHYAIISVSIVSSS
jgi:hypothetical protein